MAIEYKLESLEGVDETLKSIYKEAEGGGFVLDVAGVVSQDKFAEARQNAVDNATEAQRRRKTVERITAKLGIEDAGGLDDALDALMRKGSGKPDADQEAIISQLRQEYEGKLSAKDKALSAIKLDGARAGFQAELSAAGFPAKAAEMFASANMNRVQLDEGGEIRIMSDKGTPLAGSGADGFATLGDLSKELAAAMPEFLVDKGKGGGGKPPASGGNGAAPSGKFGSLAAKIPGFSDLPQN